jgi:hypothetical protein
MEQGIQQQDEMVKAWTHSLRNAYPDWGRERWQRRLEKKLRKRAEREARLANATLFQGYLWSAGAIMLFIVALASLGSLWWLIFPAAYLGSRGSKVIARHAARGTGPGEREQGVAAKAPAPVIGTTASSSLGGDAQASARAKRFGALGGGREIAGEFKDLFDGIRAVGAIFGEIADPKARATAPGAAARTVASDAPAAAPPPIVDPRDARVDAVCDKILLELRDSPEPVREIFVKPEQTVAALRETCKNLTRRERDVRRFLSADEDARLSRERSALQARIDAETDEVTRTRLASALAALDQQREQRLELSRSASRFEAEQTRISYTLESLYTQVVRMRSSDSASVDVAGAGLRRSLETLSQEASALADALEKVNAQSDGAHASPTAQTSDTDRLRALGDGPASAPSNSAATPSAPREKA